MARNPHGEGGLRDEARGYLRISLITLGLAIAAGAAFFGWRLGGDYVVDAWMTIPVEIRLALKLAVMVVAVGTAVTAGVKAVREYKGRREAKRQARETPPVFEFSAGSITQARLKDGEVLERDTERALGENRRQYLVRPQDALSRSKTDWTGPIRFHEPTRAGDTRIGPVLSLAAREKRKHQKRLTELLKGTGQLSSARVVLGVGKGYTSLTRAHAIRDLLNRMQAKFRMNCIVTDPPAGLQEGRHTEAVPEEDEQDEGEGDVEDEEAEPEEDGEPDTPFSSEAEVMA